MTYKLVLSSLMCVSKTREICFSSLVSFADVSTLFPVLFTAQTDRVSKETTSDEVSPCRASDGPISRRQRKIDFTFNRRNESYNKGGRTGCHFMDVVIFVRVCTFLHSYDYFLG